jgi:cobalt/nickel transport system permease protein
MCTLSDIRAERVTRDNENMHIPDGFLTVPVWASLDAVAIPAVAAISWRAQRNFQDNRVPLMGVMGAFIFAAQMINFPVGNGTSGHLVGGALLAFTVGPAAASIVLTAILAIQAFVFQDGGVLALGANIFNMALAGVAAGYLPWVMFRGSSTGVFIGAAVSLLAGALLALTELLISGVPMPRPVLAVSVGLFALSAVMEGAITVVVLKAIQRIQPGFRPSPVPPPRSVIVALGITAAALAVAAPFLASAMPDGIQKLLANRSLDDVLAPWLSRSLAGVAGIAIVYVICLVIARLIAASRPGRESV